MATTRSTKPVKAAKTSIHKSKSPLVSIIMPVYNAADFIAAAIQSVLAQTYTNWQLVIIDDESTDGSKAVVEALHLSAKQLLYIDSVEAAGTGPARNQGIKRASGEYIAFLDADDYWEPRKLAIQMRQLIDHPCDLIFSSGEFIGEAVDAPFMTAIGDFSGEEMFRILYQHNRIPILSVVTTKQALIKSGLFKPGGCEDYDLWLRMADAGCTFRGLPDKLVGYRIHPGSSTKRTLPTAEFELKVIQHYDDKMRQADSALYRRRMCDMYNRLVAASAADGEVAKAKFYTQDLSAFTSPLQIWFKRLLLQIFGRRYAAVYYRLLSRLA